MNLPSATVNALRGMDPGRAARLVADGTDGNSQNVAGSKDIFPEKKNNRKNPNNTAAQDFDNVAHADKHLNYSPRQSIIEQRIHSGEYSINLSRQQFLKHVRGTPQFEQYMNSCLSKGRPPQSQITISEKTVDEIIRSKHGTGVTRITKKGTVANVEFVNWKGVVGKYYKNGEWHDTTRLAIHYGKYGAHIVPVEEYGGDNND